MSFAPAPVLREGDRDRLAELARLPSVPSGLARRARMVLAAHAIPNAEITRMARVGFHNLVTVSDLQRHGWAEAVMLPVRTRGSARRGPFAVVFSPPPGRWSWPW